LNLGVKFLMAHSRIELMSKLLDFSINLKIIRLLVQTPFNHNNDCAE